MKEYNDFSGTIVKKSHNILFGYRFTLQSGSDTLTVSVGKGLYDIYSEGAQLIIGHIGKKLINIRPAGLSDDAMLWNSFIDTLCSVNVEELNEMNDNQKNAVLSFWYDSEVNSGGHSAYFDMYPNMKYTDVMKALDFIGASCYAETLKSAVKHKNDDYDFETEDNEFYEAKPSLSDLLMKYVVSNKEKVGCSEL